MNARLVSKYLGQFTMALGLLMLPSAAWALHFREWDMLAAFGKAVAAALALGGGMAFLGRGSGNKVTQREALGLVGIGWLLLAGVGALPFVMSGTFGWVDAYFESMSGFTTTGSTVLTDIEAAPKSILFWRSFTHWLGGMGIVVLFIAVLPYLGAGGKQLFKSESPGPDPRGLSPRIRDTASILWKIYLGLTLAQTALFMLFGMNLFEALCQTFGTLATGGFSTRQASIAGFDSLAIETITIVFMVLAGTNFALFFAMRRGNWKAPFLNMEWRVYICFLALGTLFVTLNLWYMQGTAPVVPQPEPAAWSDPATGVEEPAPHAAADTPPVAPGAAPAYPLPRALRAAAFQVVSIMTTTGFCTEDFNAWPYFSRAFLVLLMFVGGCAGSTGGGMKVVRIIVLAKMVYLRLESTFRPKSVRAIRVSNTVVDAHVQTMVFAFFTLHITILAFGTVAMSALGLPLETAATSVVATLNNIGPGLELVGAVQDYHHIPAAGKLLLSLFMAMGRLELFSVCVLFLPGFWRHS